MNSFFTIIPRELIEAIGWTIFHSLWQGLAITIVLAIVLVSITKFSAHIRYITTFASLIIMLAWSSVTFIQSYQNASEKAKIREQIIANPQLVVEHLKESLIKSRANTKSIISINDAEFHIKWILFKAKIQKQFPLIVAVWWLGLFFFLCRFIGGLLIVKQMRHKNTKPVSEAWELLTVSFANKLKINKKVILLQSIIAKVPVTIGYLKPVILLPVSVYTGLSTSEIESIIAHELAHIARRDYFFNIIQSFIEIVFFYHPAIWWISSIARTERENSCDDIAIELTGDSVNYAKALANIQEQVAANPDFAMAFGNNKNKLFKRVKRLLNPRAMKTNFKEGFIASCILISGILLIIIFTGASAKQNENEKLQKDTLSINNQTSNDSIEITNAEFDSLKTEATKNNDQKKKEVLTQLDGIDIPKDLEKELEVAFSELDDLTTYEVLKGIKGALNNMDINLIVREAMKGAKAALNNMDVNTIVAESMKGNDSNNHEDVDKISREAIKGASAALDEMDLNLIINEALKGVEGALNEIDMKKAINESINEELKSSNKDKYSKEKENKYYSTISQGSDKWNRWRNKNPDILPNLSDIHLYKLNLQEANLSNISLNDAIIDDSDLRKANLSGINASDLRVKESNLNGSDFENANLTDARFSEDVMDHINFKLARLQDVTFNGCTLRNCNFEKANLRGTNFIGCKLEKCNFKGAVANEDTRFPEGFKPDKYGIIIED